MAFPWAAAISGLSGLVGPLVQLFQDKPKHVNSLLQLVNDAKVAGIHPLAALGSSQSLTGQYGTTPINWGDAVGAGLSGLAGAAGSYMEQDADRVDRERGDAQETYNRVRDRRASQQQERSLDLQARDVKTREVEAKAMMLDAISRSLISKGRGAALSGPGTDHGGLALPFGLGTIAQDPSVSSAQDWQNRGGDIMENITGLPIILNDTAYTLARQAQPYVNRAKRFMKRYWE